MKYIDEFCDGELAKGLAAAIAAARPERSYAFGRSLDVLCVEGALLRGP